MTTGFVARVAATSYQWPEGVNASETTVTEWVIPVLFVLML